jgi:hypothetical protein
MEIMIGGASVRTDKEGRYSLNDLHRAAVESGKATDSQRPSNFIKSAGIEAFAQVLSEATNIASVVTVKGNKSGTYGVELIAMRYAAWIDPVFEVRVYKTFQAVATGRLEAFQAEQGRVMSRQQARLEAPDLTEAIKHRRQAQGKEVAHYHFSNEFDLVNRVALGKSAKEFRIAHGIGKDDPIRDCLTNLEIKCVQALQRANTTMIDMGLDYDKRKVELHKIYVTRHAVGLLAEVKRLEA